jgi:hypothetical protein
VHLAYSEAPPVQQTLFIPGKVIAIYASKKCRQCHVNGEWSRDTSSCPQRGRLTTPRPALTCNIDDLVRIEYQQFHYVRIRIESPDGLTKLGESSSDDGASSSSSSNQQHYRRRTGMLPANTAVVYQRYLSLLASSQQQDTTPLDSYKPVNPFTRKFCRYCDAFTGKWSDIESCVALSCDPATLTGSPELVYVGNQSVVVTLKNQPLSLFRPFTVLAVYSYGSEKGTMQFIPI